MLRIIPDGTKCDICGKDLTGRTMQSVRCSCERCNMSYDSCGNHLCPKCGGELLDQYEIAKRRTGGEVIF